MGARLASAGGAVSGLVWALSNAAVAAGRVRLWGLGQAGVALRGGGRLVLVDPYLSDWLERPSAQNPQPVRRATPRRVAPEDIPVPDIVLCTHEHPDHLDPGTVAVLARRAGTTRFVVPQPLVGDVIALGAWPQRVVGVVADRPVDVDGVEVLALPAAHALHPEAFGGYSYWLDGEGRHRAVGYVVTIDGVRVFHAGDTVYWPGMQERLRGLAIDVGLLPINGRSWQRERRGIVGNLTAREAAELAVAAGFRLAVPMHYDGIAGNTADPARFGEHLAAMSPGLRWALLDDDEGVLV